MPEDSIVFKKVLNIIFLLLVIQSYAHADDRIKIVTTIPPIAFFIENIGGDFVDVKAMIPPGGNPHTYEPTPRQMNMLSKADLYVKTGSGIEFELTWMDRLMAINKDMSLCDSSKGILLIEISGLEKENDHDHHHHGAKDPHIWLSPDNGIIITENILHAIIDLDEPNSGYYRKNTLRLISDLKTLKKEIDGKLKNIKNRQFFIFHPAWGYFARDFKLIQVPVEFSGKGPTPERLARLVKKAREADIRAIFTSPQFSTKSAEVIANEIDGKVIFIDPMSRDYLKNLEHTANLFLENIK